MVLAEYQIAYVRYGMSVLEALVLAKVILIGDVLRIGRRFEDKPLIVPTLYKTVVFTLWVGLFTVLEHTIEGLIRGHGWAAGIEEIVSKGKYAFLGRCLVTFFTFIPFFAFRELERVKGRNQIITPFFQAKAATSDLSPSVHPTNV